MYNHGKILYILQKERERIYGFEENYRQKG